MAWYQPIVDALRGVRSVALPPAAPAAARRAWERVAERLHQAPATPATGDSGGPLAAAEALVAPPREEQGETHWLAVHRRTGSDPAAASLTPEAVSAAIADASTNRPTRLWELLEDVEVRDLHLAGVLGVRRRALLTLEWHLEPASGDPLDRVRARALEGLIRRCENLSAGIHDLTAAIYEGVHATEILWASTASGLVYPAELAYRPTRWLLPDRDDPSTFRLQDDADPVWGVPLWPAKWIVHVARSRSRYPAMSGLGPTILWGYLFKRYGLADWVSYAEKYGSPLRMGKYPRGTPQTDIDALGDQLENLGIDAWAAIPNDMDIELKADGGTRTGADVYERLIDYLDRQVSKLILGQTLTTEAGATGTQALGTVHNEVRRDIRDGDAVELAGTLTRDLVTVMYRANFGAGAPPRWVFHTEPPTDQKAEADVQDARARVFAAARALGVTLSVEQVRRELDVQAPEGDQDVLATGAPAVPTLAGAWVGGVWSAFAAAEPVPMARLETLIAISTQDLRSAWAAVMDQVRMDLGGIDTVGALARRIPEILRTIDLEPYATTLTTSTLRAEALGRIAVRPREEQRPLPRTSPITDVEGWSAAIGMSPEAWRARVVEHSQRAQDTTRYAMLRSLQDVLARVDAAPEGGEQETLGAAIDGEMVSPQRTDAVVEAAASVAHGDGQLEGVRAAGGGLYFRYNTQRDNNVRPAHRAMGGRVYAATDTIWQTWRPPNGYGCRCYLTVHTADEVRTSGWSVATTAPTVDGEPARPDGGWGVDTKAYDWSTFPEEWKAELDKAKADRAAARAARGTP